MNSAIIYDLANVIGVIGVFLVLVAYMLLQFERMAANSIIYSMLNAVGSVFILFSLYYYWNLASGIIEIAWLIISVYGLVKAVKKYRGT